MVRGLNIETANINIYPPYPLIEKIFQAVAWFFIILHIGIFDIVWVNWRGWL